MAKSMVDEIRNAEAKATQIIADAEKLLKTTVQIRFHLIQYVNDSSPVSDFHQSTDH